MHCEIGGTQGPLRYVRALGATRLVHWLILVSASCLWSHNARYIMLKSLSNDIKCKYMLTFSLQNLAHKELTRVVRISFRADCMVSIPCIQPLPEAMCTQHYVSPELPMSSRDLGLEENFEFWDYLVAVFVVSVWDEKKQIFLNGFFETDLNSVS